MDAREDRRSSARDLATTALVALAARLIVVAYARDRFPPADDGVFYSALATRIADGLGYTWAWPDGVVTSVAHYPVGYPAILAVAYRMFGVHAGAVGALHALIGALGAVSVHVVAREGASARAGRWAGLAVALHPALLAYTPALMTEGVSSALLAAPFAVAVTARGASHRRRTRVMLAGALLGGVSLIRPQALLLVPVVALVASAPGPTPRSWMLALALTAGGAGLVVAPWTLRNARALGSPVLISANGGWNLWIGTDEEAKGGWRALDPPPECREVWDEAVKDSCFGRAARRKIWEHPAEWLRLAPAKLEATFDLGGSGLSYLSRARPDVVPRSAVVAVGAVETLFERAMLLVALLRLSLESGRWRRTRLAFGLSSACCLFIRHAWPAYLGVAVVLSLGWGKQNGQPIRQVAWGVLLATALTHAVFFGAARYAILVFPWVAALACVVGENGSEAETRGAGALNI